MHPTARQRMPPLKHLGRILAIVACAVGIYYSIELLNIHVAASIGEPVLCGAGGSHGCAEAAETGYSKLFGIPVAALGLGFYVGALLLLVGTYIADAVKGEDSDRAGHAGLSYLLLLVFIAAVAFSLRLAVVNYTQLDEPCSRCSYLYVCNLIGLIGAALLYVSHRRERAGHGGVKVSAGVGHPFAALFVVGFIVSVVASSLLVDSRVKDNKPEPAVTGNQVDPDLLRVDYAPSFGPEDAPVVLVEFSDFECPYCARLALTLGRLKARFPEDLRIEFRHFPLSFHEFSTRAATAAVCANEQGRFWEMHDALFENQPRFADEELREMAGEAGLDVNGLFACMDSDFAAERVAADRAAGESFGIRGTPTFYINGEEYAGSITLADLSAAVEAARDAAAR